MYIILWRIWFNYHGLWVRHSDWKVMITNNYNNWRYRTCASDVIDFTSSLKHSVNWICHQSTCSDEWWKNKRCKIKKNRLKVQQVLNCVTYNLEEVILPRLSNEIVHQLQRKCTKRDTAIYQAAWQWRVNTTNTSHRIQSIQYFKHMITSIYRMTAKTSQWDL